MNTGMRLAYLCADRGIPADGTKGASVHFRELGVALQAEGFHLDAWMARRGLGHPDFPTRAARLKGLELPDRELAGLADNAIARSALETSGPHDVVYERYSLFGLAGASYARDHGLPYFLEVNAPLWEEAARFRGLRLARLARSSFRECADAAERVLVVSAALGKMIEAEGVPAGRIMVFPNGVNRGFLDSDSRYPRPEAFEGRPVLLFVGSLKPWHGIEFLLDAFLRFEHPSNPGLWVVGDGPLAEALRERARQRPCDIVLEGAVPHGDVAGIVRAADITVAPYMPESPNYFCPLKVVESMAAGRPVLGSDLPFMREVLGDSGSGAYFQAGDSTNFQEALGRLLDDPEYRELLSRNARARVDGRFTWELRARELRALVEASSVTAPHRVAAGM